MSPTRRCPICVSEYDSLLKRPLVLDCGHTFCHECLYHMNGSAYRTCAVCRQSWSDRGVNDLPECYQLLPSDISSEALHCRPHNSQQLFWCLVCKEKLCRKCLRLQHRTCDWVLIEEQAEDLKAEVIGKISETEAKIKDSLASIDDIIKENKTILDLYKNLRKVLAKMNGEYTIYQQRIILLQSKLNRQTSELENLRTDWAIPPGSDLMYAVKEKMSNLEGVQAVIMWPEKPHMRCFNGLIDNFQKCRDSNYSLTDVCEGLDLPLTDDESEADEDDDAENENDNEEEAEEAEQEQEQDSGEEEAQTADDSVVTAIQATSSENQEAEMTSFLTTSSGSGFSSIHTQLSSVNTSDDSSGTVASSGAAPSHSWVNSPLFGQSSRSVSTQFSLRPVISFFGDFSTQACPFPVSTHSTASTDTPANASVSQSPSTSHQQQTNTPSDSGTLDILQAQSGAGSAVGIGLESTRAQSALSFSYLFAPARTNDSAAVATSPSEASCSEQSELPEAGRSTSLPKLNSPGNQIRFSCASSLLSMAKPASKFGNNMFSNYSATHMFSKPIAICSPFTYGFGTNTRLPPPAIAVTSSSIFSRSGLVSEQLHVTESSLSGGSNNVCESFCGTHTNASTIFTAAGNGPADESSSSHGISRQAQANATSADGAPTTTVFATFKFQPTKDEVQTSGSYNISAPETMSAATTSISCVRNVESQIQPSGSELREAADSGRDEDTGNQTEVEEQAKADSTPAASEDIHATSSEIQLARLHEEGSNLSSSGVKFKLNNSFSPHGAEDGGETSTSAVEGSNSAKKIHLQAEVHEDNSESSGDSLSSTPRTDTLSRDVTDEDSVRGQLRMIQSSDLMRAFKNAVRELRKLKKSIKSSKMSKAKKDIPGTLTDCGAEARMVEAPTASSSDACEGSGGSVRPKQFRDSDNPPSAASTCPPAGAGDQATPHTTLHSEYRKFLRRGGPFRRRLRKDAVAGHRGRGSRAD